MQACSAGSSSLISTVSRPWPTWRRRRKGRSLPFVHLERGLGDLRDAAGQEIGLDVSERRARLPDRGAVGRLRASLEHLLAELKTWQPPPACARAAAASPKRSSAPTLTSAQPDVRLAHDVGQRLEQRARKRHHPFSFIGPPVPGQPDRPHRDRPLSTERAWSTTGSGLRWATARPAPARAVTPTRPGSLISAGTPSLTACARICVRVYAPGD
jgi:hypothetical protein